MGGITGTRHIAQAGRHTTRDVHAPLSGIRDVSKARGSVRREWGIRPNFMAFYHVYRR